MPINVTTTCIRAMLALCTCLTLSGSALAATYWVSPAGQAAWTGCRSDTPLAGTAACSLSTANTNAAAGDTVYLRGGTYSINASGGVAINPSHSGTNGSPITFSAYTGETPICQQVNTTNKSYGITLNGKSWIKITGITFSNFQEYGAYLYGGSSYNQISYCTFTNEAGYEPAARGMLISSYTSPWSVHNWIHHNYFSRRRNPNGPCNEGIDVLKVGDDQSNPYPADNYNTIEGNYVEYGGHSTIIIYSKYNVIRNNMSHNDPWISGCTSYDGSMPNASGDIRGTTSTSSVTIGTGSKTFIVAPGLPTSFWASGQILSIIRSSNPSQAMYGNTTSYNSTARTLVVNVSKVAAGASGTYSDWIIANQNAPYYVNAAYNGLYGHRVFCIESADMTGAGRNLVEGNRFGFAGVNPNNDGADNLDLGTPKNIARYNFVYGGMGPGIYFKWAVGSSKSGGVQNHVYNNTSYANGRGWNSLIYGGLNNGYASQGITQYSGGGGNTDNIIKNNLVYANGGGDICYSNQMNPSCSPSAIDIVINNLTGTNPNFVNPDLTDPTSQSLLPSVHGYAATPIPDLRLSAGSSAIDGGTYLTQANGAGSNSTTLIVDDAGYFQDGTPGSDLARGVTFFADWIAIGTVTNTVQISSVNYATNTITLASPMTWSNRANIWLYKKSDAATVLAGAGPDFGASEFFGVPPLPPTNLQITVR